MERNCMGNFIHFKHSLTPILSFAWNHKHLELYSSECIVLEIAFVTEVKVTLQHIEECFDICLKANGPA